MKSAILILLSAAAALPAAAGSHTDRVDLFIGTGNVAGGLSGNNYPGATVPFGMVQLCPDTHQAPDWYNAPGYRYNDSIIYGFSHTRLSGTGASDLIDVALFLSTSRATSSEFSHSRESARPGYYSVILDNEGIKAELSATPRVGVHRYTFPAGADRNILIDLDHSATKGSWGRRIIQSQIRRTSPTTITGYRVITGWAKLRKVCFVAEFSEPIDSLAIFDNGTQRTGADVVNGTSLKAWLGFARADRPVSVRVALSPVSVDNAAANLKAEAADPAFDTYPARAEELWEKELGRIDVEGGSPEQQKIFYTALYHTMIQPNLFCDVNGEYMSPNYDVKRLPAGQTNYTTFSFWDTYRAAHPLYSLLMPARNADFVNSLLRHCDDYGYLPIWHLWGQDNYCMIGNHSIPVVAEAVLSGNPGVDAERAYQAARQSSLQSHPNSPFDVWEHYGYMPEPLQTQSVSITMEMAYDDWCVAQMAAKLGHKDDAERFGRRAGFYANLFDPATGFFRARDEKGNFIEPFDPLLHGANGGQPYTEGNAWHYLWYVPQDVPALVSLLGGKKAAEKKLDTFFSLTGTAGERNDNVSGLIGQYAHGNEPSHHVAYLYNAVGAPAKCQQLVQRICDEMYNTTASGYEGNDDCGEMSAWYIFSAMGFYPVNPASGEFELGIPLFDRVTLHLASGNDFTVVADRSKVNPSAREALQGGAQKSYPTVKSVSLDGKRLSGTTLPASAIRSGSTLAFTLR